MTPKQRDVLNYIRKYIRCNHKSPTYREIAIDLGLTVNSVYRMARRLVNQGELVENGNYIRNLVPKD